MIKLLTFIGFAAVFVTVGVGVDITTAENRPQALSFWSEQANRFAFTEIIQGNQSRRLRPSRRQVQLCGNWDEVTDGYNCRAPIWIGGRSITALFDTGASRNVIDK